MDTGQTKDREPADTIHLARKLLAEVGLFPIEGRWFNPGDRYYSVGLGDASLPIRTNGKGTSPVLALASAYGEFLERVQCGLLVPPTYGLLPRRHAFYPDEQDMPIAAALEMVSERFPRLLALPLEERFSRTWKTVRGAPFYNVVAGTVELLPDSLLRASLGSNGMCAGNTPEEALVQGLSEICERHVIREILFHDELELPTIPETEVQDPGLLRMLAQLKAAGLCVLIKDCSLGGRYPVLSVIVLDEKRSSYAVSFGAHPVFDVALERTLTEAYQGSTGLREDLTTPLDLDRTRRALYGSEEDDRTAEVGALWRDGTGLLPRSMFIDRGKPAIRKAFAQRFTCNRDELAFLAGRLLAEGHPIYVRDTGFLGFPAYRIYVPGMSEFATGNRNVLPSCPAVESTYKTILRLPRASTDELRALALLLEEAETYPSYGLRDGANHAVGSIIEPYSGSIWLRPYPPYQSLLGSYERFLSILFACTGDRAKAAKYARAFAPHLGSTATIEDNFRLAYVEERARDRTESEIASELKGIYGEFLRLRSWVARLEASPRARDLPQCGDCTTCPVRPHCMVADWDRVASRLAAKAAARPIDQAALSALFAPIQGAGCAGSKAARSASARTSPRKVESSPSTSVLRSRSSSRYSRTTVW